MTFIDTHCHLNFKRFDKTRGQVIEEAHKNGVDTFIVPGTDIISSQKAVELALRNKTIYAAVGIHPHHMVEKSKNQSALNGHSKNEQLKADMFELEKLIIHPKVVAIGEVGLDSHVYENTKYEDYQVDEVFMEAQKGYFSAQIRLAGAYKKALIIHNRETKKHTITILNKEWNESMRFRTVFHCCEPDDELLEYAQAHDIFIGVDGDVTYGGGKALFMRKVPLTMLILETDSPFLLPEPLRAQKLYPNTPANIPLIARCVADLKEVSVGEVADVTTQNAEKLFRL
jgi:TatD DNase family protein